MSNILCGGPLENRSIMENFAVFFGRYCEIVVEIFLLRSLMPGDIVRRMTDRGRAEKGICKNVHVYSNVEVIGTKQVRNFISQNIMEAKIYLMFFNQDTLKLNICKQKSRIVREIIYMKKRGDQVMEGPNRQISFFYYYLQYKKPFFSNMVCNCRNCKSKKKTFGV